jgi:hypothetical protein
MLLDKTRGKVVKCNLARQIHKIDVLEKGLKHQPKATSGCFGAHEGKKGRAEQDPTKGEDITTEPSPGDEGSSRCLNVFGRPVVFILAEKVYSWGVNPTNRLRFIHGSKRDPHNASP